MITEDSGSDCCSPLHHGCELCEKEVVEPRYCIYCTEELTADEFEVCEWCSEHKDDE